MDNKELLEAIRGILKEEVNPIKETQEIHSKELKSLNTKIDKIGEKLDLTYDEVARVREDITNMDKSIDKITSKQGLLEDVTAHNWNEIRDIKKQVQ